MYDETEEANLPIFETAKEKAVPVTEYTKSSPATMVIQDWITGQDASPHAVAIVCLMSLSLAIILLAAGVTLWRWKQRRTPRRPVRYHNGDRQTTEDDTEETLNGEPTPSV